MESSTQTTIEIPEAMESVFAKVEQRFGEKLLGTSFFRGELSITVAPADWVEVAASCWAITTRHGKTGPSRWSPT